MSGNRTNRRDFLRIAAAGAAALGFGIKGIRGESADNLAITPPPKPEGQKTVMGLVCEPLDIVRIGVIGLGMRGMDAVSRLLYVEGVEINAVCDIIPERVEKAKKATGRGEKITEGTKVIAEHSETKPVKPEEKDTTLVEQFGGEDFFRQMQVLSGLKKDE